MSHKDGRVTLSAWVDPVLRDYARTAAKSAGIEFSRWIERAVQQAVAGESAARAMRDAAARDLIEARAELERVRAIVVRVADAVGAKVSPQSSVDFMEDVPREVALVANRITKERDDALHAADVEARIVDERGVTIKQLRAEVERMRPVVVEGVREVEAGDMGFDMYTAVMRLLGVDDEAPWGNVLVACRQYIKEHE